MRTNRNYLGVHTTKRIKQHGTIFARNLLENRRVLSATKPVFGATHREFVSMWTQLGQLEMVDGNVSGKWLRNDDLAIAFLLGVWWLGTEWPALTVHEFREHDESEGEEEASHLPAILPSGDDYDFEGMDEEEAMEAYYRLRNEQDAAEGSGRS